MAEGYFIGQATATTNATVALGQDRQADHSFRDPGDPTHRAIVMSGADPSAANSLKISADGKIAIENVNGNRQAKVFFAEPSVVSKSNKELLKRGAHVILQVETADAITVNDAKGIPHTLSAIEPVLNPDAGKKSTLKAVAPSLGAQPHGAGVGVEATCIAVAESMMNKKYGAGTRLAKLNISFKKMGIISTTDATQWAAAVADAITKGGRRKSGAMDQDAIAQGYGQFVAQHSADAAEVAKKLGVNEYANPKVGESFISESVGVPTGSGGITNWLLDPAGNTDTELTVADGTVRGGQRRTGWGNHAGAVAAESAGNKITFENYARSGEEPSQVDNDPIYYFAMYGPASQQTDTWHGKWSAGATPVANAVTGVLK